MKRCNIFILAFLINVVWIIVFSIIIKPFIKGLNTISIFIIGFIVGFIGHQVIYYLLSKKLKNNK